MSLDRTQRSDLYISDLDGTLLQSNSTLSPFTVQALQRFIQAGGLFSVATARTWESAQRNKFLDPVLPLSVPVVLMNGALIYDTQARRYVQKEYIPPTAVREMMTCVKSHGLCGWLYQNTDQTHIYHGEITRHFMRKLYGYRKGLHGENMVQTDQPPEENIVYLSIPDEYHALLPLYEDLQKIPALNCVFYPCSYEQDCWYLECVSHTASKHNAVQWLRETYHFDKIIGFGDNLNDLSLFEACDEAYAVANARDELKAIATGVIAANTDDGVARFLLERMP